MLNAALLLSRTNKKSDRTEDNEELGYRWLRDGKRYGDEKSDSDGVAERYWTEVADATRAQGDASASFVPFHHSDWITFTRLRSDFWSWQVTRVSDSKVMIERILFTTGIRIERFSILKL